MKVQNIVLILFFLPYNLISQSNIKNDINMNKQIITIGEAKSLISDKKNNAKIMHKSVSRNLNANKVYQLTKKNDTIIAVFENYGWKIDFDDYYNFYVSKHEEFYTDFDGDKFMLNRENYLNKFFEII